MQLISLKAILNGENWYQLQNEKTLFPIIKGTSCRRHHLSHLMREYMSHSNRNTVYKANLTRQLEMQIGCAVRLLDAEPLGFALCQPSFPIHLSDIQKSMDAAPMEL